MNRLQARLEKSARPYFREICFLEGGVRDPGYYGTGDEFQFAQIRNLAEEFPAARLDKAVAIARRVAKNTLERLGS